MVSCPSTLIPTSEYKQTNEKPVFETSYLCISSCLSLVQLPATIDLSF